MFWVVIYSFCNPVVAGIWTTATGNVKIHWAGVENLQNQLFSLFGSSIFAFGLFMVNRYFLNYSRCARIEAMPFGCAAAPRSGLSHTFPMLSY